MDPALVAAAMGTGPQAEQAVKLVTLQVLAGLSNGGGGRARAGGTETVEDYAYGLFDRGGAGSGDGDAGPDGVGMRGGSAVMSKVQAAIRRDPLRWVEHFSQCHRRELGADDLGTGWSAADYGRRRVDWGGLVGLDHSFMMMAEMAGMSFLKELKTVEE